MAERESRRLTRRQVLAAGFGALGMAVGCHGHLARACLAQWRDASGTQQDASGTQRAAGDTGADQRAYVRVSPRDPRYFELSDGQRYVPIGLNLAVSATGVRPGVSRIGELPDYERWFRRLSENGGNYARVWLSSSTFDVEHARSGQYDSERADRIDRLFPRNLAMQSIGSFDHPAYRDRLYRPLCTMPGNDVLQVHRYLDLGARLEVCHGPVDVLAADAVHEILAFGVRKPILLAESGAVERMNLWHHFARFAKAIEGIDPAAERFLPAVVQHDRLRILVLKGQSALLAWCRDAQNTWQSELAGGQAPKPVERAVVNLSGPLGHSSVRSTAAYDPWEDRWKDVRMEGSRALLPTFARSLVLRVKLPDVQ